jgi:two-component system, chemotaxis family, CheB/CheR fusion protein
MSEVHDQEDRALETLLEYLHGTRGVDFSGYKRSSLRRRILRRVNALDMCEDLRGYREYLADHPEELRLLFDSVFINVTSFFRDPLAWRYVAEEVVPAIVRRKPPETPIRVWSAGCASGEEPFSIAMLLAEELGVESYTRRVKVYATDWDEGALAQARHARYDASALENVPDEIREKYFQVEEGAALFHNGLRRSVIFGQHDLVEDAPISRIDLLLCRNTLMYFNVDTQTRILSRLHFALDGEGFLFLGRAEMLLSHSQSFNPVELRHRLFTKAHSEQSRGDGVRAMSAPGRRRDEDPARGVRLREAALDASPVAQIVLDAQGRIGVVNSRATLLFDLGPSDLGRPIQDIELSYRPVDIRSMIDESHGNGKPVNRKNVEYRNHGRDNQYLDVSITPFLRDGRLVATTITFADVTHHHALQENLQRFSENLETAYEELQSANEELETTNEELQSANEELETTNEELQAANEEMETVNEELRSTNEELQSANDRLRQHEEELNRSNSFLNAILASLRAGLTVLGSDLVVRVWNELAVDMWGMRSDEAEGQVFSQLDIGLPVAQLAGPVMDLLAEPGDRRGSRELVVDAINRKGRSFQCRVVVTRLSHVGGMADGVCILMEDFASQAEPGGGG